MKKVNIFLFIFLIVVVLTSTVYFTFFYGENKYDYTKYKKIYSQLANCETYEQVNPEELTIKAKKLKITDDKYRVSVSFGDAKFMMKDVNILIIDEQKNDDFIYPSSGLLNDKTVDIIVEDSANSNQKRGINLDFISSHDVDKLFIYFSYIKNDERIEKYYEVNVDVATR